MNIFATVGVFHQQLIVLLVKNTNKGKIKIKKTARIKVNKMRYFFSIIVLVFLSCKTETEINTNVTSKQLPNNKLLEVLKTEKTATKKGVFTGHDYSATYSFEYQFTVNKNEVIWKDKGSAVPKTIVFCKDTIYIKYLQKKSVAYQQVRNDTITQTKYKDTIVEKYDKFIDNRYFFKWFGSISWGAISKDKYNAKKTSCNEYTIPNDEDFKNIKNPKKGYVNYEVLKDSVVYHYIYRSGINWYRGEAVSFTVKGADPKTFREMTDNYAKDSLSIYHKGHKLRRRDVGTFRVVKRMVTADKYGVYLKDKIIRGSHGPSFKFISNTYAIDKNQAYYLPSNFYKIVKGADTKTFKIIDDDYAKDKKHVYFKNLLIENANKAYFEPLRLDFSKDDKTIFYQNVVLKEADYNSFHVFDYTEASKYKQQAEDKNNFYRSSDHGYDQLTITKKE